MIEVNAIVLNYISKELKNSAAEIRIKTNDIYNLIENDLSNYWKSSTYQDFVNKGIYHKHIPNPDAIVNFDASVYVFDVKSVEKVDSSYAEPTGYEEVINYYSSNGYVCSELIEKE